ncbi:MAG: Zn-ribbon domain-containing OB-fold protein [Anaerolineales bacterium]
MDQKNYYIPITSVPESAFHDGACLYNFDQLRTQYAWDSGIAIGEYLAGLREGKILGAKCPHCHRVMVPPRTFCEWCFQPINEFIPLLDSGTVLTYSICYVTWDVQRISEPEIPAVIEIDGASKNHGILHKLSEVDPNRVSIGMRVRAVWKPTQERIGDITDILYFRPE